MSAWAPDTVDLAIPSHPRFLPLVRAVVDEGAQVAGFGEEDRQQVVLAVSEGVSNVMRHGYGGCTEQRIDLRLRFPPGEITIEIQDYGRYVGPDCMRSRALDDLRPGGLGVHLMQATMDLVDYARNVHGGTTLTLAKRLGSPPVGRGTS